MNIEVLYEDKNILAVNKPAGLLVHAVKGKYEKTEPDLVDWISLNYPGIKGVGDSNPHNGQHDINRPGIVHRLDRYTSGVMLIAKNQEYFDYLKKLFQSGNIEKTYLALVKGRLEGSGVINKPIGIKSGTVKRTVHIGRARWIREAETHYSAKEVYNLDVNGKSQEYTLVEVKPKTGRTHQIRVHMASIGHPVAGDNLYGPKDNMRELGRYFLHAESIEFDLPDSNNSVQRMKVSAPLPEELSDLLIDKEVKG